MRKLISDRNKKKIIDEFGKDMEKSVDNINKFYLGKREKKRAVDPRQQKMF